MYELIPIMFGVGIGLFISLLIVAVFWLQHAVELEKLEYRRRKSEEMQRRKYYVNHNNGRG